MEVLARNKLGRNTRAVSTIRFSKDGKYFFCSDKHNDSNVYCFETEGAKLVGQNKCGSDPVFDAETGANNVFGVSTKRGCHFFHFDGSELDKKRGIFGSNKSSTMISMAYNAEDDCFYSGTGKGSVYEWKGNSCVRSVKLHEGSIRGLQWANGVLLSSGSRDNKLIVSKNLEALHTIELPSYAKSLDFHHGKYIAATSCGKVIELGEGGANPKVIMQGHSAGETWGLAIGPEGKVYTTADDNKVISWDPATKKCANVGIVNETRGRKFRIGGASTLSPLPPNQHSRAVTVNANGHVAIGTNDGCLSVRSNKVHLQLMIGFKSTHL